MSFKRCISPATYSRGEALTPDLIGIGFVLSGQSLPHANIENTLVAASIEGVSGDFRTLGLLTQWLEIHLPYVNADRLVHLVLEAEDYLTKSYWIAVAQWQARDRRLSRLLKNVPTVRTGLLHNGTDFQIRRHGEDFRFKNTCLKVPANLMRSRNGDILSPKELVKRHTVYQYRVIIGPSYRADMWALLEINPTLNAAELARLSYGSFATAWGVLRDKKLADQ